MQTYSRDLWCGTLLMKRILKVNLIDSCYSCTVEQPLYLLSINIVF
jgi:hypothetical protein